MDLSETDLTKLTSRVKLEVIQYIKENLRAEIEEEYGYYGDHETVVKLYLNGEEIGN